MQVWSRSLVVLALAGTMSVPLAAAEAAPKGMSGGRAVEGFSLGHVGTVVDSETETDLATGDVRTFSRTEDYDNRGRLVHSLEQETLNGVVLYSFEATAEFGDGIETIVSVGDGDGEGPLPPDTTVSTFTYDKRGDLSAIHATYDVGTDGVIDSVDHEVFTRDRQGRELTVSLEIGAGPGGPGLVIETTYTYDRRGNVTSVEDSYDFLDTPQSPDERVVNQNTYDSRGNFLSGSFEEYAYDESGTQTLAYQSWSESTYDRSGRRVGEHSTADEDGDGTIDYVSDTEIGYDRRGNQTSAVQTSVSGGSTEVVTQLESFDKRGNSVLWVLEIEVDGQLDFRVEETNTFDTKGRFSRFTESVDLDGDGNAEESVDQVVTSWDGRGRVTGFTTTEVTEAGTAIHQISIEWFKYYQVRTSLHDDDNDGTWDRELVIVRPLVFG